jgi:hypothetical protein
VSRNFIGVYANRVKGAESEKINKGFGYECVVEKVKLYVQL